MCPSFLRCSGTQGNHHTLGSSMSSRSGPRLLVKELGKGSQAYFISPLIEESEALDLKMPCFKKSYIFGQRARFSSWEDESEERCHHAGFKEHQVDVLVSTTIEVGVNVPNATVMVSVDADRFVFSQLHQLEAGLGGEIAILCYSSSQS